MTLKLLNFEPGTYIEISDTMGGFRKLGLVDDSGVMYFDDAGPSATPFPIYEALKPVALGNPVSWGIEVADAHPKDHSRFAQLHAQLSAEAVDTLTLGRALYWAYTTHTYDFSRALAAGRAATQQVVDSRAGMDRLLGKAAAA